MASRVVELAVGILLTLATISSAVGVYQAQQEDGQPAKWFTAAFVAFLLAVLIPVFFLGIHPLFTKFRSTEPAVAVMPASAQDEEWKARLPMWLSPATPRIDAANFLLERAQALLSAIPLPSPMPPPVVRPGNPQPSAIARALANIPPAVPPGPDFKKGVAQWERDVSLFLSIRAPECKALFSTRNKIPAGQSKLRAYVKERQGELEKVHARL